MHIPEPFSHFSRHHRTDAAISDGTSLSVLMAITKSEWMALSMINIILLIDGTFIDTVSVLTIFVPFFLPMVKATGIAPFHFGVVAAVNLTIGIVHAAAQRLPVRHVRLCQSLYPPEC